MMQDTRILEGMNYDIDITCIVHWEMFWYSTPTNFNKELLSDGMICIKHKKVVNCAIKRYPAPTSLNNDLLNDGAVLEEIQWYDQLIHRRIFHSFFVEKVNTESVLRAGTLCDDDRFARAGVGTRKRDEGMRTLGETWFCSLLTKMMNRTLNHRFFETLAKDETDVVERAQNKEVCVSRSLCSQFRGQKACIGTCFQHSGDWRPSVQAALPHHR